MTRKVDSWSADLELRNKVVLVECHRWVLAVEAAQVIRAGFAEDIAGVAPEDSDDGASGFLGTGRLQGMEFPTWDLGRKVGSRPLSWAYLLLQLGGDVPPTAVFTGRVLAVDTLSRRQRLELPAGLHAARPGTYRFAFEVPTAVRSKDESMHRLGLGLDLRRVFDRGDRQVCRDSTSKKRRHAAL